MSKPVQTSNPTVEQFGPASLRTRIVSRVLRATVHPFLSAAAVVARPWNLGVAGVLDRAAVLLPPPRGTIREVVPLDGYRAEWVTGPGVMLPASGSRVVLYFHGGGFLSCGLRTHRRLVARISTAAAVPVFNVDYRQLPKHPVSHSIEDAVHAYQHLLTAGYRAEDIVVAGDSAGGLLAFSVGIAAVRDGTPVPAGIMGLSPWLDLDCTALYSHANNATDPFLSAKMLDCVVQQGFVSCAPLEQAWSPMNANLAGLPPMLIQVGSREVLRCDSERMVQRLADAGVPVTLQIWDRQPHVFQAGADVLPEARVAITRLGQFVREVTGPTRLKAVS